MNEILPPVEGLEELQFETAKYSSEEEDGEDANGGYTYQEPRHDNDKVIVITVDKEKKKRLGLEVKTSKKKGTKILKVSKDGLGARSGLLPGDIILFINDVDIHGWKHFKVNEYIKKNPVETFTILRDNPM